jgi:hypothetical protein
MRIGKWAWLLVLVPVGIVAWGLADRQARKPIEDSGPALQAPAATLVVGTASCSARGCHGAVEPISGSALLRDEYTTWVRQDIHASAYRVLFGETARSIMANLSSPLAAHQHPDCLACHAVPETALKEDLAWMRPDGVGCESCHGAAGHWLDAHTAAGRWAKLSLAEKQKQGMMPLDDPLTRARACVGCHVGAPPDPARGVPARDVNHDLIAAGHPRLNFELTAWLANLPAHWNRAAPRYQRNAEEEAHSWMVGQVVSARAALELLGYRAGKDESWPELAEYDCFSCHHDLKASSWRQRKNKPGNHPGQLSWGAWYFSLLPVLPVGKPEDRAALLKLKTLLQTPHPAPKAVLAQAKALANTFREWESRLPAGDTSAILLERLSRQGPASPPSWDLAAQLLLAVSALDQNPAKRDARRRFQERLAFPPRWNSPEPFAWEESLDKQLADLLKPEKKPN